MTKVEATYEEIQKFVKKATSEVLVPRRTFIQVALAAAKLNKTRLDPLELEKVSGVSRASVYKELKEMEKLGWFKKVRERELAWSDPQMKALLESMTSHLEKTIKGLRELRSEL